MPFITSRFPNVNHKIGDKGIVMPFGGQLRISKPLLIERVLVDEARFAGTLSRELMTDKSR